MVLALFYLGKLNHIWLILEVRTKTGGRSATFLFYVSHNFNFNYLQFSLHTSSEDPNNRSSKDVQHLGPATDFYKRLALDCSGQQIAVDLFLLNSQYSDLATLCEFLQFNLSY